MSGEPQFPCPECSGPMGLKPFYDTKYVYCLNRACPCALDGFDAGLLVGDDETQPAAGLPRPVIKGRTVPWVVPVIGAAAAWTALNAARVEKALAHWLCQYCGEPLDSAPTAWVAVDQWVSIYVDAVAAGGALHKNCMDVARGECPALRRRGAFAFAEVRREDQADEWNAVRERVCAAEWKHGQLPEFVPLQP